MSARTDTEACFSCGALVPAVEGPTHDYMLSTPGCWATYGEVLAREYEDSALMVNHQMTVDAYAVQHPGEPVPAARRSVHFHLVSLCAVLEEGISQARATRIIQALGEREIEPRWLEPPGELGEVTVGDVHTADGTAEHLTAVERWARSAWDAWSPHHDVIRRRVEGLL